MTSTSAPPDWRDADSGGARVRLAAWLVTEAGEGNSFTPDDLHKAFPDSTDILRRLRDLRSQGWKIALDRTAAGGALYRLEGVGEPVWDPAHRRARLAVSTVLRGEVMKRDDFRCSHCGIAAGEGYFDGPDGPAVLEVAHIQPLSQGGTSGPENLVALCSRCHAALTRGVSSVAPEDVSRSIRELSPQERTVLLAWMARDERSPSPVERAWSLYRHLAPQERKAVLRELADAVEEAAGGADPVQ
ncbi:HNH endonuclease [Streptomyces sp. NPDC001889]